MHYPPPTTVTVRHTRPVDAIFTELLRKDVDIKRYTLET